jgi:CRISPR-associated protein Csb2
MSAVPHARRIGPTAMDRAVTSIERHATAAPPIPAADRSPARSVFGELLILRQTASHDESAPAHPLGIAEELSRALRGALLHHAEDPPPPVLSGHAPDGRPHTAFLALPDLASPSGTVRGAAIALPREIEVEEIQAVLLAAARWERSGMRLWLGRLGEIRFERVESPAADPAPWVGPASRWASITPIALDRNPGDLFARDPGTAARATLRAEEIVAAACRHIGLPAPADVRLLHRSLFTEIPPAAAFMPYPRRGGGFQRVCVHVELRFAEPILGPVFLGVGRYFGMGSCAALS